MAYQSENKFKQALLKALRSRALDCFCIETGRTTQGIPDVFVMGRGGDVWLELKNEPERMLQDKSVLKVDWRPGQQAWMLRYYLSHHQHKCCLTVIALHSFFAIIPMTNIVLFENNMVPKGTIIEVQTLEEVCDMVIMALDEQG